MQSHVAYGHVGNAVAAFTLQRLGYEVTALHTVLYSNHLGYPSWRGERRSAEALSAIIEGIEAISAMGAHHALLLGYLGQREHGRRALKLSAQLNAPALCVIDPVMGDLGGLYVDTSLVSFYRDEIVGEADVLTPNAFELGVLAGVQVIDRESAKRALEAVLRRHMEARESGSKPVIAIAKGVVDPSDVGEIHVLAASSDGARLALKTPRLDRHFAGAGDLFSALLTASLLADRDDLEGALHHAAASTYAVLAQTARSGSEELALIAAQRHLERAAPRSARHVEAVPW